MLSMDALVAGKALTIQANVVTDSSTMVGYKYTYINMMFEENQLYDFYELEDHPLPSLPILNLSAYASKALRH